MHLKIAIDLSRPQCVNGLIKFTFCKSSMSRPFKPETIPNLVFMELHGNKAGKQRSSDATRYGSFQCSPNVYVNVFHGAVNGKIKQDKYDNLYVLLIFLFNLIWRGMLTGDHYLDHYPDIISSVVKSPKLICKSGCRRWMLTGFRTYSSTCLWSDGQTVPEPWESIIPLPRCYVINSIHKQFIEYDICSGGPHIWFETNTVILTSLQLNVFPQYLTEVT